MRFTATCVIVVVLIKALMVYSVSDCDCTGRCNIVFCGQSSGPVELRYAKNVADLLRLGCYRSHQTKGSCRDKDCNFGTVFYKNDMGDKDVCPMYPFVDFEIKHKCIGIAHKDAKTDNTVVTDNKLELCFKRANNDPGLMANVDSRCKYTVVVVARNDLTNSDVTTLKAEAKKLKDKCAKIRCYVVGDSATYDTTYDDICDVVRRYSSYHNLHGSTEFIYDDLKCCPEGTGR